MHGMAVEFISFQAIGEALCRLESLFQAIYLITQAIMDKAAFSGVGENCLVTAIEHTITSLFG
jgi:hypothetical protein